MDNDQLDGDNYEFRVTRETEHGTLSVEQDGNFTYTPDEGYCNTMEGGRPDYFIYEVCTPDGCVSMTANIIVDCGDFKVYTGFSPNGDGINDFFRIDGLEQFEKHSIRIFNRWGSLVFETQQYNNDWYGTHEGRDLPDGTYFYMIETDGNRSTGYLQIGR